MRLATAIRMGSLLIAEPNAGDSRTCAIGMGLISCGKLRPAENDNYDEIVLLWPWLEGFTAACPSCGELCESYGLLAHPFDYHVQNNQAYRFSPRMTIEQLCDFIDSIDPTPRDEQRESEGHSQEVNTELDVFNSRVDAARGRA